SRFSHHAPLLWAREPVKPGLVHALHAVFAMADSVSHDTAESPSPKREDRGAAIEAERARGASEVEERLSSVLGDTVTALEHAGLEYAVIGGIASSGFGRHRSTRDIDVLVRPDDAHRALAVLAESGFRTDETDPRWLFKAWKREVLVDVIFSSRGGIIMDD